MKVKANQCSLLVLRLWLSTLILTFSAGRAADLTLAQAQARAEKGDAEAEFVLGKAYYTGEDVPKDYTKAFDLYRKSANQGNAKAENNLASMYGKGEGVKADPKAAADWYLKAAKHGSSLAEANFAELCQSGEGVPRDLKEAVQWYQKAADQGLVDAQRNLGRIYDRGNLGAHRDPKQAVFWYRKAAEQGDAESQLELGRHYFVGLGVEKDIVTGYKWLLISASQGNPDAQVMQSELRPQVTQDQLKLATQLAATFQAQQPNLPAGAQH